MDGLILSADRDRQHLKIRMGRYSVNEFLNGFSRNHAATEPAQDRSGEIAVIGPKYDIEFESIS